MGYSPLLGLDSDFAAGFDSLFGSDFVSDFFPLSPLLDDESLAGLSAEAAFL
jgi:hypothetical protein